MLIPNANTKTNNANTKTKSSKIKFQNEAPVYHTCYTFVLLLVFDAPLFSFYKIVNKKALQYLIDYLPTQDLASINFRKRPACNLFFRR